jgi:hypothetical protein
VRSRQRSGLILASIRRARGRGPCWADPLLPRRSLGSGERLLDQLQLCRMSVQSEPSRPSFPTRRRPSGRWRPSKCYVHAAMDVFPVQVLGDAFQGLSLAEQGVDAGTPAVVLAIAHHMGDPNVPRLELTTGGLGDTPAAAPPARAGRTAPRAGHPPARCRTSQPPPPESPPSPRRRRVKTATDYVRRGLGASVRPGRLRRGVPPADAGFHGRFIDVPVARDAGPCIVGKAPDVALGTTVTRRM